MMKMNCKIAAMLWTILCMTATTTAAPDADAYGDALPSGALLRLGTVRWRAHPYFLAFTPDGKTLVTGESNLSETVIRCLDTTTGKDNGGFLIDHSWTALALSANGKAVAFDAGVDQNRVVVANLHDGKEIRRFEGMPCRIDRLQFSPDGKIVSARDRNGAVRLFDVESGHSILDLTGEGGFASSAFSPDGTKLALVGRDHTLRVQEIASKTAILIRQMPMDSQRCAEVSYSPDGKKLLWADGEGRKLKLLDAATGETALLFQGVPEDIASAHFSPDGKSIASTDSRSDSIQLWDAETGNKLRKIAVTCRESDNYAFSPDGKQLAAADYFQGVIHLWDVDTGKDVRTTGEHQGDVSCVRFSPTGLTAITGCADGVIRVWDAVKGTVLRRFKAADGLSPYYNVILSDDRGTVAVAPSGGPTDLYDLASGKKRARLDGGEGQPSTVVFAHDGKTLVANGGFPGLRFWETQGGKMTSRLDKLNAIANYFVFAPDGKTLAAGTSDYEAKITHISILETSTGKGLRWWNLSNSNLYRLRFSPDGGILAAGGAEGVRLWDVAKDKKMAELVPAKGAPAVGAMNCLAFSADGKTLAAGSWSGRIYVWEVATAKLRAVLTGHWGGISGLDFSPDGSRLISGSNDTTALIWDLTAIADEKGAKSLTSERVSSLWDELADADAGKAWRAGWRLVADPASSVPFLQKHMRPAEVDASRIAKLIAALDGDTFEGREEASHELAKLGDLAEPALRKALAAKPSLEARRRLEELLDKLNAPVTIPEQVRSLRGVEVLEHIGSPEARRLLDELAKGAEGARLTRDAKAALERLSTRKEAMP